MEKFEVIRYGDFEAKINFIYVDYITQESIPKDSAYWYKNWIEKHT